MTIKRTLTVSSDPGHGWLSVSHSDILTLGIADNISTYSYMNTKRAFLEEDRDMTVFMEAAKAAGWIITLKDSYTNGRGKPRSMANYNAYWVRNPIGVGSLISTSNPRTNFKVFKEDARNYGIVMVNNAMARFRLTKSNPYARIHPPVIGGTT